MGFGDVKMMAMVGAFVGTALTLFTILVGSVLGSVIGIVVMRFAGKDRDYELPFGTFLSLGAILAVLYGNELIRLYQRASALLLPTAYEGFGLTAAEAMACGTPVVATPDPAVREAGGEAVAYAEPEQFADVLRGVLADPGRWSRAGLERARRFSWAATAATTVAVYREALAR